MTMRIMTVEICEAGEYDRDCVVKERMVAASRERRSRYERV